MRVRDKPSQPQVSKYPGAEKYPEGAPRIRPFYWDIAKAYEDEKERQWGKDPRCGGFPLFFEGFLFNIYGRRVVRVCFCFSPSY